MECHHPVVIRTQIQLTEEQAARLEGIAAERGVSIAEVIREAVDRILDRDDRAKRFERAIRALRESHFHDIEGKMDVSVRHDEYLADISEADFRKR
ncbi:MAG TPA: CopG family transcriptional regulator [Actinomycetota bacterium]|nr:CopG family transcriptional regulator [Actinomycetota bacterium]